MVNDICRISNSQKFSNSRKTYEGNVWRLLQDIKNRHKNTRTLTDYNVKNKKVGYRNLTWNIIYLNKLIFAEFTWHLIQVSTDQTMWILHQWCTITQVDLWAFLLKWSLLLCSWERFLVFAPHSISPVPWLQDLIHFFSQH